MPHLTSVPRFTMPTDTDDATRRDLLLAHRVAQAEEQLAKLDNAHLKLLPLLMDLDPETAEKYARRIQDLRYYLPELAFELHYIAAQAAPRVGKFFDDVLACAAGPSRGGPGQQT